MQDLYERCSDYHELEEGIPTRAGAGEHLLTSLPPGKTPADKHVLGVHAPQGGLVGVLDLIHDYPGEGDWWIGLLMLDPSARAAGLGTRLFRALEGAIAAAGGTAIHLCVLEHNARAERFWRSLGFTELRRQPHTSASGHASRVIVMRYGLH
ncbi:MAG TPA: GNAT family N-acetyltransferase [Longimicrobium sp.]|nr:GNAT family N-acetyltransferase [Longimicrobium sp.]